MTSTRYSTDDVAGQESFAYSRTICQSILFELIASQEGHVLSG
jgi:hypothetical protein